MAGADVGDGEQGSRGSELMKHRRWGPSSQGASSELGWGLLGSFLFNKIYYNRGISAASMGAGKPAMASPLPPPHATGLASAVGSLL